MRAFNDRVRPHYASGTTASIGDVTLITGVAGSRFRILGLIVKASVTQDVKFKSGATDLISAMPLRTVLSLDLTLSEYGWMETADGEDFIFNQNATGLTSVIVVYEYI